jgi:hypothetical protein
MDAVSVCRVLAAAVLSLPAVAMATQATAVTAATHPARVAAAEASGGGASLELTGVSPAVVTPDTQLVVTGVLRNTGQTPMVKPVVRVVWGQTDPTREGVDEWATATGPAQGTLIGETRLPGTLATGAGSAFRVTIDGVADLSRSATYGALPISVESGSASVRTFAGYQRLKQYEPMSIAWAAPLTLDPDPDLFGAQGQAREAAWQQALGAGSRVSRVIEATQGAQLTWAIDPTLTPSLLPGQVDTSRAKSTEHDLRAATEAVITAGALQHTPWVLPDTDADVGAVASAGQGQSFMATLVQRAVPVAKALGGRADIAWPADGAYTVAGEAGLRRMFRPTRLGGQVTSSVALAPEVTGTTPPAAQRSATGLPLLAYDQQLSTLLAHTTSPDEAVLSTQQFVAESAALLNELPGTPGRSVFVVAPRSFNPDPVAAQRFLAAAATVPWLTQSTTGALLDAAAHAVPTSAAPVTRPAAPSGAPQAVLTTGRLAALEHTLRTVHGVALIREDGDTFQRTWARAAEQLASTRWRGAPTAWNTLGGEVVAATRDTTTAIKVAGGTINFLADSGRLQITVTNDLAVPVENVKLTVEASNPRLRIDSQPPVMRIGPKSRATVSVRVTALAAGLVPLRTTLTTPDGTVIGQGANVMVHVTPTGDWVYWGLGGLAVVVLLVGLVRSFRHRPSRRSGVGPVPPSGSGSPAPPLAGPAAPGGEAAPDGQSPHDTHAATEAST